MEPVVQKISIPTNMSFIAQTRDTAFFEVGWHQHTEYELVLFLNGSGTANIGKYAQNFEPGDIFLLGSNLPHVFQKYNQQAISAIVVHFSGDCFGIPFLNIPECQPVKQLLDLSSCGLLITSPCKNVLRPLIKSLETAVDMNLVIILLQCLQAIVSSKEYITLTTQPRIALHQKNRDKIDKVYKYTLQSFREPLCLAQVATLACMSIASFSDHFKRRTNKTYIDFLNEVRIEHACSLLIQTDKPVNEIGYESGFNTEAYFYRLFSRTKQMTPLQYRKKFYLNTLIESIPKASPCKLIAC